ncbi:MAG: cytochrome c2 [Myxococcaceae bacterium]|nr:cytochrome c2 [Myxococcaceae bacterium]
MHCKSLLLAAALLFALAGCNEKKEAAPAPVAAVAPVAAAPEAPPAPTGPDGPPDIVIPSFEISATPADIGKGKDVFAAKGCIACHKVGGGKLVGPDLKDVLVRRTQPWVMKMILKPEVMLAKDDVAKAMFRSMLVPMANQNVDPINELPFILAYLKSESAGPQPEAHK